MLGLWGWACRSRHTEELSDTVYYLKGTVLFVSHRPQHRTAEARMMGLWERACRRSAHGGDIKDYRTTWRALWLLMVVLLKSIYTRRCQRLSTTLRTLFSLRYCRSLHRTAEARMLGLWGWVLAEVWVRWWGSCCQSSRIGIRTDVWLQSWPALLVSDSKWISSCIGTSETPPDLLFSFLCSDL